MNVTTINIIDVNESKQKHHLIEIESEKIHELRANLYVTSFNKISFKSIKEN